MYAKKDIIYSSTMGLVMIKDVTKLSADKSAPVLYYVLRSYYDKEKTAYIPVENHEVELRNPIDVETAEAELESMINDTVLRSSSNSEKRIGELAYVLNKSIEELNALIYGDADE